jgi:hypothetical protein
MRLGVKEKDIAKPSGIHQIEVRVPEMLLGRLEEHCDGLEADHLPYQHIQSGRMCHPRRVDRGSTKQ